MIIPNGRKGKKYVEWKAEQEGSSWRKRLQADIDEYIRIARSYEDFLRLIREKGYTVTGEEIGDPHAKYRRRISLPAPEQAEPLSTPSMKNSKTVPVCNIGLLSKT